MEYIKDTATQKSMLVDTWLNSEIDGSDCQQDVDVVTSTIVLHKDQYKALEIQSTVPWHVSGIIHHMEADCNFRLGLANGDPWNRKAKDYPHVGPYNSWLDSAVDALKFDGLDKVANWDISNTLYYILKFNGLGCFVGAGINSTPPYRSAYLWSYTTAYDCGKYTSDGHWDPKAQSDQVGAAAILKDMVKKGIIPSFTL